jgi:GTP diphosphokinase / guanosine-3',5'-bis(diphosphate) 3'-diphosphatase
VEDTHRSSYGDHIFAITPNGDIIELPEGATTLDFAFNVHSMLGLCFKAARVNGHIVPLSYEIQNGDIIEILRHKEPKPSANWLLLLKTSAAKARLKRYLVEQDRPAYLQTGKESFNELLSERNFPKLDPDLSVLRTFDGRTLNRAEREDLLVKVGQGAQNAASLLPHLDALNTDLRFHISPAQSKALPPGTLGIARVDGNIPMPVRFARCCSANEKGTGPIIGVIGRDGVVRVHRRMCKMTRNANPERMIGVRWEVKKKEGKASQAKS